MRIIPFLPSDVLQQDNKTLLALAFKGLFDLSNVINGNIDSENFHEDINNIQLSSISARVDGISNPATLGKFYVSPALADGVYDYAYIPIIGLPNNVAIRKIIIGGKTSVGATNVCNVKLMKCTSSLVQTTTLLGTATISNGESEKEIIGDFDTVTRDYYYYFDIEVKTLGVVADVMFQSAQILYEKVRL